MYLLGLIDDLDDFSGSDANLYWPVIRSEGIEPPPLDHLMDSWLRARLQDADLPREIREELDGRPVVETMALVDSLPSCDLCAQAGRRSEALFNAPQSRQPGAAWANLCVDCYATHGTGTVGLGQGQVLVTPEDLPWSFKADLARAINYWKVFGVTMDYPLDEAPPDSLLATIAAEFDHDEDELGPLAGIIRLAHLVAEETLSDREKADDEFAIGLRYQPDGTAVSSSFAAAEGFSPDLGMLAEELAASDGPWALVASPGPDDDGTQLLVMAAGCAGGQPVAGLTTIRPGETPIADNGWKFGPASEILGQPA